MKNPIALLLPLLLVLFFFENAHAAVRPAPAPDSVAAPVASAPPAATSKRAKAKKERRLQRFFAKLKKWAKAKKRSTLPDARRSLTFSLALLVLAIVLFAISSEVGFLSILGSVAVFGAIGFFILWLLKVTRDRSLTAPSDE